MDFEKLEQELAQAGSVEEIQEIIKNNGAEVSQEEIEKVLAEFAPQGELGEDDLDAVAGGVLLPWWKPGRGLIPTPIIRGIILILRK